MKNTHIVKTAHRSTVKMELMLLLMYANLENPYLRCKLIMHKLFKNNFPNTFQNVLFTKEEEASMEDL